MYNTPPSEWFVRRSPQISPHKPIPVTTKRVLRTRVIPRQCKVARLVSAVAIMACPYSSCSQRRGNLLLPFALLLMGRCDFVECAVVTGRGGTATAMQRQSLTGRRRLKSEDRLDEKGDLLEKNVGRSNPPKATPLSPSSTAAPPFLLATDRPTVAAPPIPSHQSPTVRQQPTAEPPLSLQQLSSVQRPSFQGWNGTASPFSKRPTNESQYHTSSIPTRNGAPMNAPSNAAPPNSTPLEASLINAALPSSVTTTASVSGSLLLLRRRHKYVQRTTLERKTFQRRVVVELNNDTMGTHGNNNDKDHSDSRLT
jgi:hypothetical protein